MVNGKRWVALFSQTGSEISSISSKFNIKPDLIYTNNLKHATWHPFISTCNVVSNTHTNIMQIIRQDESADTFYTLHGYLRIIDEDIVNACEMYNGHPGLITKYPELKGKDPQETVAKNLSLYDRIGSVIHKVSPETDSGEILYEFAVFNSCNSRNEVYDTLKITSLHSWLTFFKGKIGCE